MTMSERSAQPPPANLGALLAAQARALGDHPFVTYYDDTSGERTELSYATFDNWVSKTANLFAEELSAGRGTRIALRVTDHWVGAVVVAAAWKLGALVMLGPAPGADVVVVEEQQSAAAVGHPGLVVVGAGLGGRVTGDVAGVRYGDEVLAFGDDYSDPEVTLDDACVSEAGRDVTQRDIYARHGLSAVPPDARLLATRPLDSRLGVVAAPLCSGASVVWSPRSTTDLSRRISDERVTHRLGDDGSTTPV